jgi:cold shock CspA family protein
MHEGIITYVSGKGWFIAEDLGDHSAIFIHQSYVENKRFLKVNDIVSFDLVPSERNPGKTRADNVKFLRHIIVVQYSDKSAVR